MAQAISSKILEESYLIFNNCSRLPRCDKLFSAATTKFDENRKLSDILLLKELKSP